MRDTTAAASLGTPDEQWNDVVAAKLASRREFIARQLDRSPEQRLAVMVKLGRRVAALHAHAAPVR